MKIIERIDRQVGQVAELARESWRVRGVTEEEALANVREVHAQTERLIGKMGIPSRVH